MTLAGGGGGGGSLFEGFNFRHLSISFPPKKTDFNEQSCTRQYVGDRQEDDVILFRMLQRSVHV